MIKRISFNEEKPTLYLITTPIGNLKDITYRAVEVLNNVDVLYAEDTRVTKKILDHYNINKTLYSYHKFNEEQKLLEIKEHLEKGLSVGFCSDAGMPGISDPGYLLTSFFKDRYPVVVIPGATAGLTALVASGLKSDRFTFIGFLDPKKASKIKTLEHFKSYETTLIFYESATKLNATLSIMAEVFGKRKCVIARELTKLFETFYEFHLGDDIEEIELKGEFVILVEGYTKEPVLDDKIISLLKEYLDKNYTAKDAVKEVSEQLDENKNRVYKLLLTIDK